MEQQADSNCQRHRLIQAECLSQSLEIDSGQAGMKHYSSKTPTSSLGRKVVYPDMWPLGADAEFP
jgi:hypothetical protein